jgi:PAS domain S-box-containing protein
MKPHNLHPCSDVREHVLAEERDEQALKQAEEQYRQFFFAEDLTGDFLATPDGRVLLCNGALAEMFGYASVEAIMAETTFSIFPQRSEREKYLSILHTQKKVKPHEREFVRRDGQKLTVIESLVGLFDASGTLCQVQGYLLDISERKQMEERMLQAERLAAIGQLVAGLAHESGNALQGSQACLERLAWRVQDRPEAIALIERIQRELDRLHRLYDDVRGYAGPLRLSYDLCDLAEVWRRAWAEVTATHAGRDVRLHETNEIGDLYCEADAFRMEQVFRNVLENAMAACRDPVRIEIHCSWASLVGRRAIEVAVRDNGPGLGAEQRQRIFEPFYTTKTRGTGLGMAIAQRIVEAHGGRIAVGEKGHPGAEILITLPRRKP